MYNYTMDCYELKRDILNFAEKISRGCKKSTAKFAYDMQYGLAKGGSCLISNIARSLNETINLKNTIERLCDNLVDINDEEINKIKDNYYSEIYSCKSIGKYLILWYNLLVDEVIEI